MEARAVSKHIRVSPRKMREYVDVVRGNNLEKAFFWLKTCSIKRVEPLKKVLFSAYHNAKNKDASITEMSALRIKEIRVDEGKTIRYFRPTAMGRVSPQRRRLSHVSVIVETI